MAGFKAFNIGGFLGGVIMHALGGASHIADTLANLNNKITDGNVDDRDAPRPADQVIETNGPTLLDVGAILDGQALVRSGGTVIGKARTARFFVPAGNPNTSLGDHNVRAITGVGNHRFIFTIPHDFASLISLALIARSAVTLSADIDITSDYGKEGEDYNNHSEARDGGVTPTALTANQIERFDVSDVFSNIEAGDVCGFNWDNNSIGGNLFCWGVEIRYNVL